MPRYAVGDIVVVPFPFSGDPGTLKRRPAVVLATWSISTGRSTATARGAAPRTAQDYLLALITSQATGDPHRVPLTSADVIGRPLTAAQSFLRPTYLFAADEGLIAYKMAALAPATLDKALLILHQVFAPVGTPSVATLQAEASQLQGRVKTLETEVKALRKHLQGTPADDDGSNHRDDSTQETG